MVPKYKSALGIGLLLILAALVRFYDIGEKTLWGDEFHSLRIAAGHIEPNSKQVRYSPLGVLYRMWADTDVPLYFILLNLWIRLFGNSEAALRSLSAVFGIGSIWILYRVGRALLSESGGLISAFLLALAPLHVYYAQEARAYALQVFFILLSTYFFIRIVFSDEKQWSLWLGYELSALLALSTHYLAVLVIVAQNVFLILGRRDLFFTKRWIGWQALLALAWLIPFFTMFYAPSFGWVRAASPFDRYWPYVVFPLALSKFTFADYAMEVMRTSRPALFLGIPLVGALFFFGTWGLCKNYGWKKTLFLYSWLWVPIILLVAIDIAGKTRSAMIDRYIIAASPPYYLILAAGLTALKNMYLKSALLAAVALLFALALFQHYQGSKLEQWKEAGRYIAQSPRRPDLLVFYPGNWNFISYYTQQAIPEKIIEVDRAADLEDIGKDLNVVFVLIRNTQHLIKAEDLEQMAGTMGRYYQLVEVRDWKGLKILKYERK